MYVNLTITTATTTAPSLPFSPFLPLSPSVLSPFLSPSLPPSFLNKDHTQSCQGEGQAAFVHVSNSSCASIQHLFPSLIDGFWKRAKATHLAIRDRWSMERGNLEVSPCPSPSSPFPLLLFNARLVGGGTMWRPSVTRPPTLLTREITLPKRASRENVKESDKDSEGGCGSFGLWCADQLVVVFCGEGKGDRGEGRDVYRKKGINKSVV